MKRRKVKVDSHIREERKTDWEIKAKFLKKNKKRGKSMKLSTRDLREKREDQDLEMREKVRINLE